VMAHRIATTAARTIPTRSHRVSAVAAYPIRTVTMTGRRIATMAVRTIPTRLLQVTAVAGLWNIPSAIRYASSTAIATARRIAMMDAPMIRIRPPPVSADAA